MDDILFKKNLDKKQPPEKIGKLLLSESLPKFRKAPTVISDLRCSKNDLEYGEGVDSVYRYVNEPEQIEVFLDQRPSQPPK